MTFRFNVTYDPPAEPTGEFDPRQHCPCCGRAFYVLGLDGDAAPGHEAFGGRCAGSGRLLVTCRQVRASVDQN